MSNSGKSAKSERLSFKLRQWDLSRGLFPKMGTLPSVSANLIRPSRLEHKSEHYNMITYTQQQRVQSFQPIRADSLDV